jgi:hypothetical protein
LPGLGSDRGSGINIPGQRERREGGLMWRAVGTGDGGKLPLSSGGLYSRKMQMGELLLHKGRETKVVNAGQRGPLALAL